MVFVMVILAALFFLFVDSGPVLRRPDLILGLGGSNRWRALVRRCTSTRALRSKVAQSIREQAVQKGMTS